MTETNYRALCAELVETLAEHQDRLEGSYHPDHPEADRLDRSFRLLERARAALAQPVPVGLTEQDVAELAEDVEFMQLPQEESFRNSFLLEFTRQALTRWGTPNPITEELT